MRLALLSILAVIGGAAAGLVIVMLGLGGGDPDDAAATRLIAVASRADVRDLADRVAVLERALAGLPPTATAVRAAASHLPDVDQLPSADPEGGSRAAPGTATATTTAALDPRRLLAEYVGSFANGGEGSDFFRMAVAAYAWQLRRELQAIVVDHAAPDALRLQVMAMLEGGSFRGDGATLDALLEVLRQGGWEQGATTALGVLAKIGDRRTAELIEAVASGLEPLRVRVAAWSAIAQLCPGDAEAVLLRLFERERDPEGREQMIVLFRGSELAATLRVYELASRMEKNVRLAAAGRIGRFRDEPFGDLIESWLASESDEEVRARLLAALEQRKQVPGWHELQATGAPNVADPGNDDQHAWASAAADGGREWIELTYATALRANRVTIHETCAAGCVVAVELFEENGGWRNVFNDDDPMQAAGPLEVRFATTNVPVKKVRVTLDTKRKAGWNEIDAVELAGPDGAAWATGAVASSRYGEGGWGNAAEVGGLLRTFRVKDVAERLLLGGR